MNKFSWSEQENELKGIKPYPGFTPDWYLLEVPNTLKDNEI